jgi:hypothetical protein
VFADEIQKFVTFYEINLAVFYYLGRCLMGYPDNAGTQTEYLARFNDPDDDHPSVLGIGRKLYAPAAKEIDPVCRLALYK